MKRRAASFAAFFVLCFTFIPVVRAQESPTALRLNRTTATIGIDLMNRSVALHVASALYPSGSGGVPSDVTWTTSDPNMVSLAPNRDDLSKCVVTSTGGAAGSCSVVARSGDAAAICTVTVRNLFKAKSIKIIGAKTVGLGIDPERNRFQLGAKILPDYASANDPWRGLLEWRSSDKRIATVDQSGRVTALRTGTVRISCTIGDGSKKKASMALKVVKLKPASISLPDQTVAMLRNIQLEFGITPDNAYDQRITWKSSDPRVAKVSSDGFVRGLKPGTAVISATAASGDAKASCTVTVIESLPGPDAPSPSPTPSPSPGETAEPSPTPTPSASVRYRIYAIGNSAYQRSSGLGTLASAETDAQVFGALYSAAKFPGGQVSVSVHKNLTASAMKQLFTSMRGAEGIDTNALTIIYYQGHAYSSSAAERHGALLGVDGEMITVSELRQLLDAVPGKVMLVLDNSFSGRFLSETALTMGTKAMLRALAQTFRDEKYMLICGCGATGYVLDTNTARGQQSLLMRGIEAGLSGSMAADGDGNGRVTLDELHRYVKASVDSYVAEMNKLGNTYEQDVQVFPVGSSAVVYAK